MERNYWATILYRGDSDFLSTVGECEERRLAGVAVPQVYGPPFVPLAVAAMVTKRLQLATGIAVALTRSPFETAMAALDLDHLSQGRFILGLGTGPTRGINRRPGPTFSRVR
jgi:alkanesulfonate monooxygenase SsuD/methylene tetrahydromethanopterin reductase-like flavin-dependent oxidoreductase (luciferase family)